jgi:threonine-phosphate decarboxylase
MGIDAKEIIDFSSSINPLGPPPAARRAFLKSFSEISRYPDEDGYELKGALAQLHGVKANEVLLGNGSTQLIRLLCRALRPRKAVVVVPAFSEYDNALKIMGTEIQPYFLLPEHEFRLPIQDFLDKWGHGLEMIFLSNPNSVAGRAVPRKEMEEIIRIAQKRKIFLVVDEAFMDFTERESVKHLIRENPYLIVLRSLTKYYALPGLRIGYLLAQRRTVKLLGLHQEPWSVNGPAQRVALACLDDGRFGSKTSRWLDRERTYMVNAMAKMKGLRTFPSQVNFVLVRLEGVNANALNLRDFLIRRKILIRACDTFLGLGHPYLRAAIRMRKDNAQLINGIKDFLRSSHPRY